MKTTKQLIREIDFLKGKLKWMTMSRKHWKRCAMHFKQQVNEREKKEYEVYMIPKKQTKVAR